MCFWKTNRRRQTVSNRNSATDGTLHQTGSPSVRREGGEGVEFGQEKEETAKGTRVYILNCREIHDEVDAVGAPKLESIFLLDGGRSCCTRPKFLVMWSTSLPGRRQHLLTSRRQRLSNSLPLFPWTSAHWVPQPTTSRLRRSFRMQPPSHSRLQNPFRCQRRRLRPTLPLHALLLGQSPRTS